MTHIRPIRIEPAFDDREKIRAMFERYAPYRALATYAPEGIEEEAHQGAKRRVDPWFRGDWALNGKPLVEGAERILHNQKFIEAAKAAFGASFVNPEFVAVNINGPMAASTTHVDVPSFYGATREDYSLPLLRVMGSSQLFEQWRVIRASTLTWFYQGIGGNFDYWPEGLDGPMRSERSPFGNVALCADTDRIYHRIGSIGNENEEPPQMSASAKIQPDGQDNWTVLENGEVRAAYPSHAIRFSILWKAEIRNGSSRIDFLTLDRIMSILLADLRRRTVEFQIPSDPLADTAWVLLLQKIYAPTTSRPGA